MSDASVLPFPGGPARKHGPRAAAVRRSSRASEQEQRPALPRVPVGSSTEPCECGRTGCRDLLPAGAGQHRGLAANLVVVSHHLGDRKVVAAADRFFVVEPDRGGRRFPAAEPGPVPPERIPPGPRAA